MVFDCGAAFLFYRNVADLFHYEDDEEEWQIRAISEVTRTLEPRAVADLALTYYTLGYIDQKGLNVLRNTA